MRIFFFNAYFDPNRYEGSRIHIEQLAKHLTEMGHEIWVQPSSPLGYALRLSKIRKKRLAQLRNMDVFYFRIEGRAISMPYYMRDPWRRLGFEKKFVWEINAASDYIAFMAGSSTTALRDSLDIQLMKQARLVDLAICNTDGLLTYAHDLGIRKAVTIPLATDPELFTRDVLPASDVSRSDTRINVVWSGNPDAPWHDFETVRKAALRLRDDERVRFYFLGHPPRGIRFPDNVIFMGSVPYDEMPSYLRQMDVGLAVYRDGSWSRYGVFSSPLKLFDYMAARLIVVASPIEQVLKCIEDKNTGFIVPFGDDQALADRLRFIATHKTALESMPELAQRSTVDFYSWRRVARDTVEALQGLFEHDAITKFL